MKDLGDNQTILAIFAMGFAAFGLMALASFLRPCTAQKKPCTNYSYTMSVVLADEATCNRWTDMHMRLEKRLLGKDIVHCTCPINVEQD